MFGDGYSTDGGTAELDKEIWWENLWKTAHL